MHKIGIILAALIAFASLTATVNVEKAQASNPVYALQLLQEGQRVANQALRLSTAGSRSNSMSEMCGYYVPRITAKVRRERQIVRLLYIYAPSSMRPSIDSIARTVRRLSSLTNRMNNLCAVYG